MVYSGPDYLHRNVAEHHPGQTVYCCRQYPKVFTPDANLNRHRSIVNAKEYIYCDSGDGDDRCDGGARNTTTRSTRTRFSTEAQL